MELALYQDIIRARGIDPDFVESHAKITMAEFCFFHDILAGKAMWSDNFWFDWRLYLCNNHSLLSLCFANKHHPYTTKWRFYTLLSTLFASSIFMSLVAYIYTIRSLKDAGLFFSRFGINTGNGVFLLILDRSLMYLSICPCAYDKKKKCYFCCVQSALLLHYVWLFITIGCFIGSVILNVYLPHTWSSFITLYVTGWISSYLMSLVTISLGYYIVRRKDKKMYDKMALTEAQNPSSSGSSNMEIDGANPYYISAYEYLKFREQNQTWTVEKSKMHLDVLTTDKLTEILTDDEKQDKNDGDATQSAELSVQGKDAANENTKETNNRTGMQKLRSKASSTATHVINSVMTETYNHQESFVVTPHNTEMELEGNDNEQQTEEVPNEESQSNSVNIDI